MFEKKCEIYAEYLYITQMFVGMFPHINPIEMDITLHYVHDDLYIIEYADDNFDNEMYFVVKRSTEDHVFEEREISFDQFNCAMHMLDSINKLRNCYSKLMAIQNDISDVNESLNRLFTIDDYNIKITPILETISCLEEKIEILDFS